MWKSLCHPDCHLVCHFYVFLSVNRCVILSALVTLCLSIAASDSHTSTHIFVTFHHCVVVVTVSGNHCDCQPS